MGKVYFVILFLVVSSFAQKKSYPTCNKADGGRVDLEGFCPRLEGVTLPNCCPPLQKKPGLTCDYHIIKDRGQPVLANSSYQICQNGVQVSVPCCQISQRACFVEPVSLFFISKLIYRNNSCCFENCPPASYWRAQPNPNPKITAEHELTNSSVSACINQVLQECSYGNSVTCQSDTFCPPPEPIPPTTGPTTGPTVPTTPTTPSTPTDTGPTTPTDTGPTTPSVPSSPTPVGGYDE